jgi:hypothetical protein
MPHDRNHIRTIWATGTNDASAATTTRTPLLGGRGFKILEIVAVATVAQTVATATITVNRECTAGTTTSDRQICTFTLTVADFGTIGNTGYGSVFDLADTDIAAGETVSFLSDAGGDAGTYWFGVIGYEYAEGPDPVHDFDALGTFDKYRTGIGDYKRLTVTDGTHA